MLANTETNVLPGGAIALAIWSSQVRSQAFDRLTDRQTNNI